MLQFLELTDIVPLDLPAAMMGISPPPISIGTLIMELKLEFMMVMVGCIDTAFYAFYVTIIINIMG